MYTEGIQHDLVYIYSEMILAANQHILHLTSLAPDFWLYVICVNFLQERNNRFAKRVMLMKTEIVSTPDS